MEKHRRRARLFAGASFAGALGLVFGARASPEAHAPEKSLGHLVQNDGSPAPSAVASVTDAIALLRGEAVDIQCTGFHIGEGIVLTAGHCLRRHLSPSQDTYHARCEKLVAEFGHRGSHQSQLARCAGGGAVYHYSDDRDYALIQFPKTSVPPVAVSINSANAAGSSPRRVFLLGHPYGKALTYSQRCMEEKPTVGPWIQHHKTYAGRLAYNCPTAKGSSGSPVFDDNGFVIALHSEGICPLGTRETPFGCDSETNPPASYDVWNYGTYLSDAIVDNAIKIAKTTPSLFFEKAVNSTLVVPQGATDVADAGSSDGELDSKGSAAKIGPIADAQDAPSKQ